MKNKVTVITVAAVALALLVSAGIAVAAGVAGGTQERSSATEAAGDAYSFGCRNGGEGDRIRAENCVGEGSGECDGDCEQEQLRERDCDGECDGDCDGDMNQNRSGNCPMVDETAGIDASSEAYNGNCAGDCDRDQDCLQDGSCDGDCDLTQTRSGRRTGAE